MSITVLPADKARGIFLAIGVGPRLPVSSFANQSDLGYGFNLEVSYTDNEYLPIFIFAKVGFEQYPGSPDFYQTSDYTNLSTTGFPIHLGMRYYFSPILENVVLLIPVAEVSAVYTFFSRLHQFKPESGKNNFIEETSKLGISAGGGFSITTKASSAKTRDADASVGTEAGVSVGGGVVETGVAVGSGV